MTRSSSRWRFMNPMPLLKAIYEIFGSPYPRASLILVVILGAVVAGGGWWFIGKQVAKDHQTPAPPQGAASTTTGPASTSGPKSPAVTGSGNNIQYGQSPPKEKKPPK